MVQITDNKSKTKNDFITLLFLLMILSMYLVLNLHSLPEVLKGSSVLDTPENVYSLITVPLAMGLALLFSVRQASSKSLKYIYLVSILPFIISPDVLYFFNNHFLISFINIILTFLILLVILRYLTKNHGNYSVP